MLSFTNFIFEAKNTSAAAKASGSNTALGAAYETATALRLHALSGSSKNKDKAHQDRIKEMQALHDRSMLELSPEKRQQVLQYGDNSAQAYIKSLRDNHGVKPEDIREVHHTYAGIDKLVGKNVDRAGNPHDIAIVTKDGFKHGASLKFKPGTLSNSTTNTFDKASNDAGIKTNINGIWEAAKKKAGLAGLSGKELKARRDEPNVLAANKAAQTAAAKHHSEAFNAAKPAQKKAMLQSLMKTSPDLDYDYVVGSKKTSEPIMQKKHTKLVNGAKDFTATHTPGGVVHIHDDQGNHVMSYEHRPTHGAFSSIQVNGKLGSGKPAGSTTKTSKAATIKKTVKNIVRSKVSTPRPKKSSSKVATVKAAAQPVQAQAPVQAPVPGSWVNNQRPGIASRLRNHTEVMAKT